MACIFLVRIKLAPIISEKTGLLCSTQYYLIYPTCLGDIKNNQTPDNQKSDLYEGHNWELDKRELWLKIGWLHEFILMFFYLNKVKEKNLPLFLVVYFSSICLPVNIIFLKTKMQ